MGWTEPVSNVSHLPARSQLRMGMATCHELNIVEGSILGDPLDEKMFLSTEWTLELVGEEVSQADRLQMPYMKSPVTPEDSVLQAAPLKLFPFSSDLQRMTVVTNINQPLTSGKQEQKLIMLADTHITSSLFPTWIAQRLGWTIKLYMSEL